MKFLLSFLFACALAAQTTNISATALKDQQGNLVTGSLCLGPALFTPTTCQNITAGVLPSFPIANGTYAVWLNSSGQTIFTLSGAVLSGTAIAADMYLANQFAANVAGSYVYFPSIPFNLNGTQIFIPIATGLTCNGNTVTLPALPIANQSLHLMNINATTACTVSGNGNAILYQAVSVSPASLQAKNTAEIIYVPNYDFAGHNAWIVTHLGT